MKTAATLKAIDQITEELRQMALNETNARESLERLAADDKIDDAEREQRGLTWTFRLTNIPLRRAKLEKDLEKLEVQLGTALREEMRDAVQRVKAAREAKEQEIRAALAPFYDAEPDSRAVRKAVDSLHIPALVELQRLRTKIDFHPGANGTVRECAAMFLSGIKVVRRALNWTDETAA